ncbi:MAG TPA: roadblock/LC7 domain-containing protein [Drouetiella sp.]
MNARYILLLQRQFDEELSERETYELQGFLAGNESAARLCENVRKLIDECEQMEPPESLKPEDEELLLIEIVSKLRKTKSQGWLGAFSNLLPKKPSEPKHKTKAKNTDANNSKSQRESRKSADEDSDELAILRSKRKDRKTIDKDADAIASMRSKFASTPNSVPEDVVQQTSLAEAIKNKLQQTRHELDNAWEEPPQSVSNSISQDWNWDGTSNDEGASDLLPPQSTTQAADPNQSASDMRSADYQKSADPLHLSENREQELIWNSFEIAYEAAVDYNFQNVPDFSSNHQIMPIEPTNKPSQQPIEQPNKPSLQPIEPANKPSQQSIEPASKPSLQPIEAEMKPSPQFNPGAIPVDEIIAHVSQIFSEREPIEPIENDPLGATSGVYPQIREEDLRVAKNARLGTTSDTTEQRGQIKSIGKFLLDKHSEAAIGALNIHSPEIANARILSDEEAQALHDCLSPIQKQEGVAGCVIVGYDGIVITSTLPPEADKDAFSAWALFTYINSHELVRVVGHNRIRQLVSKTARGYLLLADFGQGLLVAVSDNAATEAIVPLMKSVRKVTAA